MDFTLEPKDDEDRVYYEGWHAREVDGLNLLDNPYPDGSRHSEAWEDGYYDANAALEGGS